MYVLLRRQDDAAVSAAGAGPLRHHQWHDDGEWAARGLAGSHQGPDVLCTTRGRHVSGGGLHCLALPCLAFRFLYLLPCLWLRLAIDVDFDFVFFYPLPWDY